jgi:hypothetical protein
VTEDFIESVAQKRGLTREQAIEEGRQLGASVDPNDTDRIKRAMAYAAWDYDGRPASSKSQREEMGLAEQDIPGFVERAKMWTKRGEQ